MKDVSLTLDNAENTLNGEMKCEEISASKIYMKNNLLQVHIDDNRFGAGFSFDNHNENETNGELILNGNVYAEEDNTVVNLEIRPSAIHYDSKEWNIQPSSMRIDGRGIEVDSFGVVSGEQSVGLFGRTSDDMEETLTLNMERFDISILNDILPSYFGVRGAVTGTAQLISPVSDMELMVDMICDSTYLADIPLGTLNTNVTWDDHTERFNASIGNNLSGISNMDIRGHYTPGTGKIHADATLNSLNVGYAQPLLTDIFSEMKGSISGGFTIDGPFDRLSLRSADATLNDAQLTIGFTGVPYKADGPFHIDETGVYFDNIGIRDRYDGTGTVNGGILYDYFKNITFDTRISVNRICCRMPRFVWMRCILRIL
jgi:hypothetical protein